MTNISRLMPIIAELLLLTSRMSAAAAISDEPSSDHYRSQSSKGGHCKSLPLRETPMIFRTLAVAIMLAVAGCTRYGVSGPEDLGLAARFDSQTLLITLPSNSDYKLARNQVINQWLLRSDSLCADYLLLLSRSIRDTRLATDVTATVLAGLATIFSQPAVTRPLAGAATIALGVGGDIQSDLFLQQAGDVVGTAIQAVRTRARIELQKKFAAEYDDYTLEQGLVDVQRYDRETCNLNVGLNEIRASLNIIGPVAPQANNPIIPLPPRGAGTGTGSSPESATSGTTAPVATTIIPPNVQQMPGGGLVITPGKVVNTPATAGAATSGAVPQGAPPPPPPAPSQKRRPPRNSQDLVDFTSALGSDPNLTKFQKERCSGNYAGLRFCYNAEIREQNKASHAVYK